jgi:hypothetical protein
LTIDCVSSSSSSCSSQDLELFLLESKYRQLVLSFSPSDPSTPDAETLTESTYIHTELKINSSIPWPWIEDQLEFPYWHKLFPDEDLTSNQVLKFKQIQRDLDILIDLRGINTINDLQSEYEQKYLPFHIHLRSKQKILDDIKHKIFNS